MYHSLVPKNTALVGVSCVTKQFIFEANYLKLTLLYLSLYFTDSGLVVPSITYELHKRLLLVAERHGLSLERRLEMTGVCASQMALTLLGGPNR